MVSHSHFAASSQWFAIIKDLKRRDIVVSVIRSEHNGIVLYLLHGYCLSATVIKKTDRIIFYRLIIRHLNESEFPN